MAKHRKPTKRQHRAARTRARTAPRSSGSAAVKHRKRASSTSLAMVLAPVAAAGLSSALVFGHATNTTFDVALSAATGNAFGVGGFNDPTSARIPAKLNGTAVPAGFTYYAVPYPATYPIDSSVAQGVPALDQSLKANPAPMLIIVAYSEGTLVAEQERRNLATDPLAPNPSSLRFLMIASPNVPNGGIFARFPGLAIPGITFTGPAQPSAYDTTYVTREYDPYADFPAYFNPLSLANTIVAVEYVHPDKYYDSINLATAPQIVKMVTNSKGGKNTYILVLADHLPLLQPVRDVFGATGTTFLTEPVLSAIEPLLRVLVDLGYTDRQNLNPEVPTTFSLITPPTKIVEGVTAAPGALSQGVTNLATGATAATTTPPPIPFSASLPPSTNVPSPLSAPDSSTPQQLTVTPPVTPSTSNTPTVSSLSVNNPTTSGVQPGTITHPTVIADGNMATPGGTTTAAPNHGGPLVTTLNTVINGLLGVNQPATTPNSTPNSTPNTSQPPSGTTSTSPSTTGQTTGTS